MSTITSPPPPQASAHEQTINTDQIGTYISVLFSSHTWQTDEFLLVRGVGEKGTKQYGVFAEDVPLQPAVYDVTNSIAGAAARYMNHLIGAFIVPAVLSGPKAVEGAIKLLPAIFLDLDAVPAWDAVAWLSEEIGEPSMVVASGGRNEYGPKLHAYYVLDAPQSPDAVVPIAVRIAELIGADPSFARRTQPIRVPGSIHLKDGDPNPVVLERWNSDTFTLEELAGKIEGMAASPWATAKTMMPHRKSGAMFSSATSADSNALLSTTVRSGGVDGITRWDAFSRVAGHYLHVCRTGSLSIEEAFQNVTGWAEAHLVPAWPQERIKKEFAALYDREVAARGPMGSEGPKRTKDTKGTSDDELLRDLYALQFDPDAPPPPDEVCLTIGGIPIAARGNLTGIQGKSKVGKSSVVAALLGAAMRSDQMFPPPGDTLQIEWSGESGAAIIHFDTEQSRADWHALMLRAIRRSGLALMPGRVVSLPLVMLSRSDRKKALRLVLEHERTEKGGIDLVVIDGGADIIQSPNDEAESLEVVSWLMALAQEFHCAIIIIIHENPSTEEGKTRGHFGSELNRKAFANIRIDKDTASGISTTYGTDMRKRDIPKNQGFCFGWDDAAGMHLYKGRHSAVAAAKHEAKNVERARREWAPIFERAAETAAETGTNSNVPALTPGEAAEIERDIAGTETLTKTDTIKKRMQRAEALGVLRKSGPGAWVFNPAGHAGQTWDN